MANATGWNELFDGHLIKASFTMYDQAFGAVTGGPFVDGGWVIIILFVVYQFMLLMKTRNLTLSWITGIMFASLYAASIFVKAISVQIIFVILVFELAGILYMLIWK